MPDSHKPVAPPELPPQLFATGLREPGAMALFEIQRKNLQALHRASQLAAEGFQAAARRQAEFFARATEEAWGVLQGTIASQPAPDRLTKQVDLARRALDGAVPAARELSDIVAQAQHEAVTVLTQRLGESIDEMRALLPTRLT